jgi:hypothetical protein
MIALIVRRGVVLPAMLLMITHLDCSKNVKCVTITKPLFSKNKGVA